MDHLKKLQNQANTYLFFALIVNNLLLFVIWLVSVKLLKINEILAVVTSLAITTTVSLIVGFIMTRYLLEPLSLIRQAILHVASDNNETPAPDLDKSGKFGHELAKTLSLNVYQLASLAPKTSNISNTSQDLVDILPLPLITINKNSLVLSANEATLKYLNLKKSEIINKNIYSILDLSFSSDDTLDNWLTTSREHKITDTHTWERTRLKLPNQTATLQLDIAAHYSKDDPNQVEVILLLFDHTSSYNGDDKGLDFIALAVHELRAPLTLLRGYIEVFQEELKDQLSPELTDFLKKMQASSERLSAFINNILNVMRVDEEQLSLKLSEESWPDTINTVISDLKLRASILKIDIIAQIPQNLPMVGVDKLSIYEVLANLLDNAIKYSSEKSQIIIKAQKTPDGLIETTIQDFGVGIPESVLPNLFQKFYRNHRNQTQIGGTGLGLYLCKAIIDAHGGNIWVRSQEGHGTTFGFTLIPFSDLADEQKNSNNTDIIRQAHGWIKNHSLYRR